ncbi:MAG: YybH family protein [Gammaproteobacteria bacterium]
MSEDDSIRTVIKDWARAVEAGDRAAILARHALDLLMFDFPATVRGLDAYGRTWDFFFKNPRGPISFVPRDIAVTAAEDVAPQGVRRAQCYLEPCRGPLPRGTIAWDVTNDSSRRPSCLALNRCLAAPRELYDQACKVLGRLARLRY